MSVPDPHRPDYRQARIGAAVGLTTALIGLLFIDAISPAYEINSVVLAVMATMILGLLGLEAKDIIKR